ncbi:hypothetical protein EJ05DRAFT_480853 [Pseudovirgaria hyperparasitica]|uniref:Uncharacterized protein n=1 Tax=Pseudovirgaria hyperparasitica TaxID=470096 RepID=A0A6A6VUK9_9PEZI|nr:uncharacterized protein EJ05DRAFT_480853 [Pseudovirgaria hyperparasitica]KAF2752937.1 hypothetical protein EJ05DRAFT_480853 [Pseudovirgaria hyperparasitica]
MRARMFRDDLERVVDEIENSEIMWLGIQKGVHGYDEIDVDEVSVRSEVARLTRLYDRAIKNHLQSNPEGVFETSVDLRFLTFLTSNSRFSAEYLKPYLTSSLKPELMTRV